MPGSAIGGCGWQQRGVDVPEFEAVVGFDLESRVLHGPSWRRLATSASGEEAAKGGTVGPLMIRQACVRLLAAC